MKCDKCSGNRIFEVLGDIDNTYNITLNDSKDVIDNCIVNFNMCLECGKIQGLNPLMMFKWVKKNSLLDRLIFFLNTIKLTITV